MSLKTQATYVLSSPLTSLLLPRVITEEVGAVSFHLPESSVPAKVVSNL